MVSTIFLLIAVIWASCLPTKFSVLESTTLHSSKNLLIIPILMLMNLLRSSKIATYLHY
jgi:hypothetical protein